MKSSIKDKDDKKLVVEFIKKFVKADREQYVVTKVNDLANDLGFTRKETARSINLLNKEGFLLFRPTYFHDGVRMQRVNGIVLDPNTGEIMEKYEIRLTTSPLGLALV